MHRLVAFSGVTCLFLASCVEPTQYGGPIPVDQAGTLARLSSLCAVASQPVCGALAGAEDDAGDDAAVGSEGSDGDAATFRASR